MTVLPAVSIIMGGVVNMAQWFVVRGGRETGPLTTEQIKAMAAAGKILPSDQVRKDDGEKSRLASTIKGLFPTTEARPAKTPHPVR